MKTQKSTFWLAIVLTAVIAIFSLGFSVNTHAQQTSTNATTTISIIAPDGTLITHESQENHVVYGAELSGEEEIPEIDIDTRGHFIMGFDPENPTWSYFELRVWNGRAITQAHLHCGPEGETGPIIAPLLGFIEGGFDVNGNVLSAFTLLDRNIIEDADCEDILGYDIDDMADLLDAIQAGDIFVNVHNVEYPGGVVRGQVSEIMEGSTQFIQSVNAVNENSNPTLNSTPTQAQSTMNGIVPNNLLSHLSQALNGLVQTLNVSMNN